MTSPAQARALQTSNHRYELLVWDGAGCSRSWMTVIDEALFIGESEPRFFDLMRDPELSTVTLTVTEKGYCSRAGELDPDHPRLSDCALSWVVRGLHERQKVTQKPLHVLSCDNLQGNGRLLERLCQAWSKRFEVPYNSSVVSFPDSMVDRIVPAGDSPLEIATEAFHQWVIEDRFLGERPAWDQPGLMFVPEVEPFERMKLCLLNASHSFLAYYGQLQGHEFVHQAIRDPRVRELVERLYFEEVGPSLHIPAPLTLAGYGEQLLRRFDNPNLPHRLNQIAMDGSQKIPQRFLTYREQSPVLQMAVEAWFEYLWLSFTEARFEVRDPLKESLRESVGESLESSKQNWKDLLGWAF